jgi:(p)ppGpp synthase/HD superfamily hydrolase
MICAALLHDVVEDTDVTLPDLAMPEYGFGFGIVELVRQLTDVSKPSDGNRAFRKELDRIHTAGACSRAKTIKLADLIDNSCSIVVYDPDFARAYMREKRELMKVLREGNAILYSVCEQILQAYEEAK